MLCSLIDAVSSPILVMLTVDLKRSHINREEGKIFN